MNKKIVFYVLGLPQVFILSLNTVRSLQVILIVCVISMRVTCRERHRFTFLLLGNVSIIQ